MRIIILIAPEPSELEAVSEAEIFASKLLRKRVGPLW
jgi:hypothetical protein